MLKMELTQQEWVEEYSEKMMEKWHNWQSPLGIDDQYKQLLAKELAGCYTDPLKRELVETTY